MYKNLIRRRIGTLVEQKLNSDRREKKRIAYFSDDKRKEIIVWMRLYTDKDKDQIIETIQDKFNISDADADTFFYEAYPEGLDKSEEGMLNELDTELSHVTNMKADAIKDAIDIATRKIPETALDQYNLNPLVKSQIKITIETLLKRRKLA